ncbi:TonB-dependent receptor [Maribacter sp. 4U21]|uniref:TonB-dependent receptor family protein n=1 Tax=Maribacter sp. 4U21 TaxID=1889779 RepID=UPI000C156BA5|nr:TonB-dependent receptor [Maribacter sp. 4U21]PIB27258.1 TonB-dependent receptor [Maribacter sp. 4U21]
MKHICILFFLFFNVLGISQDPQKRDSITVLNEVVLIDTLTAKNSIGIVPSKIIGAKVFQNYSPVDLVNSINQVSGVYALSGALNTNRITIRGVGARTPFGTDKLRLYYNNIPVTNGTGFSTIEAFDLENLTSFEIIKGPKATGFGTNLGGAIVLNTKKIRNQPTKFINNTTIGSYGLLKNSLGFVHSDENFHLTLQYGHMEIDGYRENNRFERDGILLNSNFRLSSKSELGLLVNHIDYTAQIASSISQSAFDEDPKQAAFTWKSAQGFESNNYTLIGLSHTYKHNAKLQNTTSLFYTYLDHYEPRPFNILDEYTNGYGFRTLFAGALGINRSKLQYTFGGELYKDEYTWGTFENLYQENNGNGSLQGDRIADNKEFRRQFNGFATVTSPISQNFTAQLGININKTNYNFRDLFNTGALNKSAERNFNALLLPSLDLTYLLRNDVELFANLSRGFSNPSLEETLTPDGLINPDIKQETGTNYELGVRKNNGSFTMEAALYHMRINNLLVAERVGDDQFIGRNAGKTQHQGLDLDINYRLSLSEKISATPFVSYTFNNHSFIDFVDGDEDFSENQLTGVPKHRIVSGLQTNFGNGLYWNTTYQFVDKISLRDEETLFSDSFSVLNTRIGFKTTILQKLLLGLDFGINNILNTTYAQSVLINASSFGGREPRYFYPGNDRNYYGSLKLNYTL